MPKLLSGVFGCLPKSAWRCDTFVLFCLQIEKLLIELVLSCKCVKFTCDFHTTYLSFNGLYRSFNKSNFSVIFRFRCSFNNITIFLIQNGLLVFLIRHFA